MAWEVIRSLAYLTNATLRQIETIHHTRRCGRQPGIEMDLGKERDIGQRQMHVNIESRSIPPCDKTSYPGLKKTDNGNPCETS